MPKSTDKDITAYRESCTQCVDLRRQVSALNAKLAAQPERPKYELKWRGCEIANTIHWSTENTRDALIFLNVAMMLLVCGICAFADRGIVSPALLFFWPFIPAVYLLHAVKIVKKKS